VAFDMPLALQSVTSFSSTELAIRPSAYCGSIWHREAAKNGSNDAHAAIITAGDRRQYRRPQMGRNTLLCPRASRVAPLGLPLAPACLTDWLAPATLQTVPMACKTPFSPPLGNTPPTFIRRRGEGGGVGGGSGGEGGGGEGGDDGESN